MDRFLSDRMIQVNKEYFQFAELPQIRWSRGVIKKRYRKLTFGTYDIKKNQIRIHPLLKSERIPTLVIDFVIFHELLHFADREDLKNKPASSIPVNTVKNISGRRVGFSVKKRSVHNTEFHKRERMFNGKQEATLLMHEIVKGNYKFDELFLFEQFS